MKTPSILAAGTALILLSACGDELVIGEKAQRGAAIGATVGVLSGITTDDSAKDTIARGVIGGIVGGAIGNQLDKQEADLREDLGESGALIRNTGSQLIVTLPESITFDTDSTAVRGSLQNSLVKLAANLNDYPNSGVDIIGHTDDVGDEGYNQGLSFRRADSVSNILLNNGVAYQRVRSYGRGETTPVASNGDENGRAQNRRVEIVITPAA